MLNVAVMPAPKKGTKKHLKLRDFWCLRWRGTTGPEPEHGGTKK